MTYVYQSRMACYSSVDGNDTLDTVEDVLSPSSIHATLEGAKESCGKDLREWEEDVEGDPAELKWEQTSDGQWGCFVEEYDWQFLVTRTRVAV